VTISGFVELREESQKTDRFVLRVKDMEGGRMEEKPERVRLSVKRGTAPPAGAFVEVKAMLDPPLQPLEPGSYDFARDLFFQGIGASGFVRGRIAILAPPDSQGLLQRADASVQRLRDAIDARILVTRSTRTSTTPCLFQASVTCCRSRAITWRLSPASSFSFSAPAWP
jgi:competence protein ComEC